MRHWPKTVVEKYVNAGTPLFLMGALWLYLWVFPWYDAYLYDPHWGHNYAEALAFLAVGLAYFNGRLISDVLALLASILIIPAALELLPHPVTAIAGGVLGGLIIVDMIVERGRKDDLGQPSSRRLRFWLKSHLLRFAYLILGHIALIYFVVRLPQGTYETELVTKVYDGMSIPFLILALAEGAVKGEGGVRVSQVGFFWGMLTMIVSLILLSNQPETWVCMAITVVVTALGIAALVLARRAETPSAQSRPSKRCVNLVYDGGHSGAQRGRKHRPDAGGPSGRRCGRGHRRRRWLHRYHGRDRQGDRRASRPRAAPGIWPCLRGRRGRRPGRHCVVRRR